MRQLTIPHRVPEGEEPSAARQSDEPPRVLAVFAHPDDEVFCAGGTIARWVRAGAEVTVVSATHGEAGQIRDVRVATRHTLGEIRETELRLSCRRLGVSTVRCWDYLDGTLADADFDRLVDRVAQMMREYRPETVISFGPDGGYGHPDHVTISAATTAAWRRTDPAARLLQAHFPNRDTLLMDRLASWLTTRSDRFAGSSDYVHALLLVVKEAGTMRYLSDHEQVQWYPAGSCVVEQGEAASELFIILSGFAEVWQDDGRGSRRRLRTVGPGEFFGELGVAGNRPRSADVVALESLTCLVLSRGAPTKFAGRGAGARLVGPASPALNGDEAHPDMPLDAPETSPDEPGVLESDVSDVIAQKVAALCAYRTQLPLEPDMFPAQVLTEIFGRECFIEVPAIATNDTAAVHRSRPAHARDFATLGSAVEVRQ